MSNIDSLLKQISVINKHYKELSRLSGEDFNLFKVINLTTNEVRIHSAFIAELLNPYGSHGQGNVFLKLFVEQIEMKDFDCESASVEIEKYIGPKDEITGGRIDIFICDRNRNCIIIENKIYAIDQENQLIRYSNFCKSLQCNFKILYLTLDGKDASDTSVMHSNTSTLLKRDEDYFIISYQTDIIKWLEKCRKEAAVLPTLREGITHYINLIRHLTNQSTNKAMSEEIANILINSPENIETAMKMVSHLNLAKTKIQWNFWVMLREALTERGLQIDNDRCIKSEKVYDYYHASKKLFTSIWIKVSEKEDTSIWWGAEIENNFYTGFSVERKGESERNISNNEEFKNLRNCVYSIDNNYDITSEWWLGWKYLEPKLNFRTFDTEVCKLADKTFLEQITNKIADEAKAEIDKLRKCSLQEGYIVH